MITIIDYGMGNIGSLENMIQKVGGKVSIATQPEHIATASKIILPGVGSFDNGMKKLADCGFIEPLIKRVQEDKIPLLGICLGMQLLTESSEEGKLPGLGLLKAKTKRFKVALDNNLKIPHMGWNEVIIKKQSPIFLEMTDDISFYFVHSYFVVCDEPSDILGTTIYGQEFVSAIQHENIFATQFHPEKSHKYGMKVMKNFLESI